MCACGCASLCVCVYLKCCLFKGELFVGRECMGVTETSFLGTERISSIYFILCGRIGRALIIISAEMIRRSNRDRMPFPSINAGGLVRLSWHGCPAACGKKTEGRMDERIKRGPGLGKGVQGYSLAGP